ncbi:MAG: HTH domain-containing protein [Bacteroidota bacterium]|nr:HTH domain-containing protein [Bacteroidota bacterium]
MSYTDFLEKRETLQRLIESEKTGTAEELANRLSFSRRTLFNYFDLLENENQCIKFCRVRKTYYFEEKHDKK